MYADVCPRLIYFEIIINGLSNVNKKITRIWLLSFLLPKRAGHQGQTISAQNRSPTQDMFFARTALAFSSTYYD